MEDAGQHHLDRLLEPEPPLVVTTTVVGDCHVLVAGGVLAEVVEPLEQAISACSDGRPAIVDLSGVTFISSAAIHVLLKRRSKPQPVIVCPPGSMRRVLDIVCAGQQTDVFDDLASAIERVRRADS
jgi:anti-anti-sigma regulatory factor